MKRSSFFTFLAAGVIVLLLIGIGGFYWLFGQSPLPLLAGGVTASEPGAAMFVSKQAPVMVSMLVNPDRLEALQKGQTRTELEKLKTSLLANSSLDYQKDIRPWLGDEITLVVTSLDIDRNPENGQQPGYLMALASANPSKSREFVDLFFSKRAIAGANLVFEEYKGVKLITDNSRPEQDLLSAAVIDAHFVLFANHPKVLREAINNVQAGDLNLTSSSKYQQALKQLPPPAIGFTYLNLPTVTAWQGLQLTSQIYDTQIIALELNSQGLLAETTLLAAANQETLPPPPQISKNVGALQYIPAAAGVAISGSDLSNLGNTNLAQFWTQVSAAISGSGEDGNLQLVQPVADFQQSRGINLSEDIFSWVQGEYAIGLLPRATQTTPDWIFVTEKSEAANTGISHLDAIASSQGLSISSLTLADQKVFAWTELTTATTTSAEDPDQESITLKAKVRGMHTTLGNYEIFTSSIEAMNKVLKAKENSLADNRNFQDSIAAIPRPNQGYIYLDWNQSHEILEGQIPILKLVEVIGKPFFNNLRSLTISSYGSETGLLKAGVFLKLED